MSEALTKEQKHQRLRDLFDLAGQRYKAAGGDPSKSASCNIYLTQIDGIRTTRQYGLAWWFADQRPASISKDAFTHMGTYFFCKGMNAIADRASMESATTPALART